MYGKDAVIQWTALLTNNYFICNDKNINDRFRSTRYSLFTLTPILFKQLTFITATSGFVVDKQGYGPVTLSIILHMIIMAEPFRR